MKQNGFTLLELLVVTGIMIGITGFAISNYNDFNRVERLRQTGKTLKSDLRWAQSQATSGIKPSAACTASDTLQGYTLTFTQTSYSIQATCLIGGIATAVGPTTTVVFPTSSGVTFSSIPINFQFNVITGAVSVDQTLALSAASHTYTIKISSSGDINDSGNGLGFQ